MLEVMSSRFKRSWVGRSSPWARWSEVLVEAWGLAPQVSHSGIVVDTVAARWGSGRSFAGAGEGSSVWGVGGWLMGDDGTRETRFTVGQGTDPGLVAVRYSASRSGGGGRIGSDVLDVGDCGTGRALLFGLGNWVPVSVDTTRGWSCLGVENSSWLPISDDHVYMRSVDESRGQVCVRAVGLSSRVAVLCPGESAPGRVDPGFPSGVCDWLGTRSQGFLVGLFQNVLGCEHPFGFMAGVDLFDKLAERGVWLDAGLGMLSDGGLVWAAARSRFVAVRLGQVWGVDPEMLRTVCEGEVLDAEEAGLFPSVSVKELVSVVL